MTQEQLQIVAEGAFRIYTIGEGGGKGGGGHTPVEASNTLRSAAIVRVVEALGEGPIEGLAGGKSGAYINDTPFTNEDGSPNFGATASLEYRVGLPDQDYLPGFSAVESELGVNTPVTNVANNIVRTTSGGEVDAVLVTIQLPNGLHLQDKKNGDMNGSTVTFRIDARPEGGTYATVGTYTISGKTMSAFEAQYRVLKPGNATGSQRFDVRVTRITGETGAEDVNAITWSRMTEIQEVKVSYPDAAVVGIAIDAQSVGNTIPKRGYLVKGLLTKIPTNLDPDTRTYTGLWNGQFKTTTKAFDNPVWCLYDFLTSERYGAGINPVDIDAASFYAASVYCDENVPYTNSLGQTVNLPRFTFSTRIADRAEVLTVARNIAGSMNANLIYWNGKWTLVQDRPDTSAGKTISKANIIGMFEYGSSGLFERHTAVNMTYNDRYDRYLQRVVTREATIANNFDKNYTDKNLYGYNPIDVVAYGCTTEGQAIRAALYTLITEIEQNELVSFEMGFNGFDLMPGDIFNLFDEDRANVSGAGRIASITGTTVVLDRPVDLTPSSTIQVLLADGTTVQSRNIVQTSGKLSTITVTAPFTQAPLEQGDFYIASAISAKQFKVMNITCPEEGRVRVEAVFHDPGKYARIEQGIVLPKKQFSNTNATVVSPPDTITFSIEATVDVAGTPVRRLRATWIPPANETVAGYDVIYRFNNGNPETIQVQTNYVSIPADFNGTYAIEVFSRDFSGRLSGMPAAAQFTLSEGTASSLSPVTGLFVKGTTGTLWNTDDLTVEWTNPLANEGVAGFTTRDFLVSVYSGATLLRQRYVPGVAAGQKQTYTYTLADNLADGGPRQTISIKVQVRDAGSNLSAQTSATFTAASPSNISNLQVRGTTSTVFSTLDLDVEWTSVNGNGVTYYNDPNFAYFQVDVLNGAVVKRQQQVYDASFKYTFSDNVKDNGQDSPSANIIIRVSVINKLGGVSAATSATFTPAAPPAVTSLYVKGTTSNVFNETDLNVTWVCNDAAGKAFSASNMFKRFTVEALNAAGTLKRTQASPAEFYTYFLDANSQDNVTPIRNPSLRVTATNVYNVSSSPVTTAFSNPAPAVPSNLSIISGIGNYKVTFDQPNEIDYLGAYIWASTTSNFTPSSANLVADVAGAYATITAPAGVTYYVKVAAYDYFGKGAKDGVGLNVSTQSNVLAIAAGIPKNATAPTTGMVEGDTYLNTTDGKLYRYFSGAWTAATPTTDLTGTISIGQLAANSVGVNQLAADSVTTIKLSASAVSTDKLAANAVTVDKLAANSVSTDKLQADSINSTHIQTNSIVAGDIDSRNLTIKDGAGNIVFAAGSAVPLANIPAGALNSNVTAGGIGAVQTDLGNAPAGILNSNVTATGIGAIKTDLTNAPSNILNSNVTPSSIGAVNINLSNAPAGIVNGNVYMNSNGVLSGAGGGQATIAGMDATVVRAANPINTVNVSTYIASGAIGEAYIGNASISNAKIQDLAVNEAKLGNASISNAKIQDLSVSYAKIGDAQIGGVKIYNGGVTANHMSVYSLDAVTARIGTLRTGTTGGRMEISDNQLRVYDENNVLRVIVGAL